VPPNDSSFWQGAFRENDPEERAAFGELIARHEPFTIEVLYGDVEGGQRTISRFSVVHFGDDDDDPSSWIVSVIRHWNLDRGRPPLTPPQRARQRVARGRKSGSATACPARVAPAGSKWTSTGSPTTRSSALHVGDPGEDPHDTRRGRRARRPTRCTHRGARGRGRPDGRSTCR